MTSHPQMRVLSLCTGIGGIDLAAEVVGMEIVGQVEIDPFCCAVLEHHWPEVKRLRDLKEVRGDEFGTVYLIVAGFPCQPASHAGKRRGASDDRWLWPDVYRVIQCARPAWVLLENVPGLISLGLDTVLSDLERAGYEATACVYPASAVGAPHQRERVFIVGHALSDTYGYRCWQRTCESQSGAGRTRQTNTGVTGAQRLIESVADTPGTRLAHRQHAGQPTDGTQARAGVESEPERCSGIVADANCEREPQPSGRIGQQWRRASNQCQAMVYASGTGCEECDPSRVASDTGHATRRLAEAGQRGQVESSVGQSVDGLSGRLAGHPGWPARPGETQYEWEAPRTVPASDRTPGRAAKLKALGNAVVPAQVLPTLQAIAATWEGEQRHVS